ncbi:hypothetical protein D1872_51330 [compost metagenome]
MSSVYEFDMSPAVMEERTHDSEYPVLRYVYLPMGESDRQGIEEQYAIEEGEYNDCTQWLVLEHRDVESDTSEIQVWPLAADYSGPYDTPILTYDIDLWDNVIDNIKNDCLM